MLIEIILVTGLIKERKKIHFIGIETLLQVMEKYYRKIYMYCGDKK